MRVTVTLASALTKYADGERHVVVDVDDGSRLSAVIELIGTKYPGVRDRTLDDQGSIRRHVNVFVNQENVRFLGGLDAALEDGAEVSILPAVSGGQ